MARPEPIILATYHDAHWDKYVEIVDSPGFWYICYQGQPVAIRHRAWTAGGIRVKYPRTGFNNPAHAHRLADKLNKQFDTQDFTVRELK